MVVLVTGASGQLGQAVQSITGDSEITFYFAPSSKADITDKANLQNIFDRIGPQYCINAAAYTAVDKSESEPEKAYAINVSGVENLALICNDFDCTLIHISTDFVFDGNSEMPYSESATTNPQGVYGRTKLQGEQVIAQLSQKYFIIRTAWLYSEFGNNFMKTMLRLAAERDSLSVVNDQIGTPTNAVDLAKAIVAVIESGSHKYGVYHFSNEGTASWYDFAKKIFECNSISIDLKPISTAEFPTPAKRPKYSVLDKSKFRDTFGINIQKWEDALKRQ